jgi:thioesterase domain-containing protein/acyl carrier protein
MTNSPPASLTAVDLREQLLEAVRKENPGLQPEDAFEVPTSFVQQKKWIEDPAGSDSVAFNYPILIRLRGPLDERALQQSLREIVRRHGVFRSVFRIMDGKLIQIVLPSPEFSWSATELGGPPETREQHCQEAARKEASRPFSFEDGPILRARLMRLASDDAVLQLTTHTIVYDDWSTGVLIKELSAFYSAFAGGASPPHRELPYQFGDFVRWRQQRLQGPDFESHLDYWKPQLDLTSSFEHLPADFPRPPRNSNRGARQIAVLSPAQVDALKALSRQQRVSLFMVLLAGFQSLLHRHSGHEEISVASCVANRPLLEVEGLIGRFGNSTLYHTNFAGNPSFVELLKRVREVTLMAASHQEVPFAMVLNSIDAGTGRIRIPPFQCMFILQNAPKEKWQLAGLKVDFVPYEPGTSTYDLIVWLKSEPALQITLEYNTDLFDAATMKRVLDDYRSILAAMANNPGTLVGTLPISAAPSPQPDPAQAPSAISGNAATSKERAESQLIELWEAAFGLHPIRADQNFFELGGDSLLAARLFTQIEKAFKTKLPLATLVESPTIAQLAEILSAPTTHPSSSCLVAVQPKGTQPPLFCVHGHGGEIFFCWNLSRCLGMDQPLFGLRSQGLSEKTAHYTVEEMAAHYLNEIRTVQPHGPYYLGGYCFGGMVAYEMARSLTAQGEKVAVLAMFNTPAPGSLDGWPMQQSYLAKRITHELRKLGQLGIRDKLKVFGTKTAGLGRLALGSFRETIWRISTKLPLGNARELTQRLLSVPDINVAAAKAYAPGPYAGRSILFLTEEVSSLYTIGPKSGWAPLVTGGIEVYNVGGDNISMFDARFVEALAEKLRPCINRAHAA